MPAAAEPNLPLAAAPASTQDEMAERVRGRLMAVSLGRLLGRVRGAREVLPHLAALERSLALRGAGVLNLVPPQHLKKICQQLSGLPSPPDDPPLADLQQRLLDLLKRQMLAEDPPLPPPQLLPTPKPRPKLARDDSTLSGADNFLVAEISHTDFQAALGAQDDTHPMSL